MRKQIICLGALALLSGNAWGSCGTDSTGARVCAGGEIQSQTSIPDFPGATSKTLKQGYEDAHDRANSAYSYAGIAYSNAITGQNMASAAQTDADQAQAHSDYVEQKGEQMRTNLLQGIDRNYDRTRGNDTEISGLQSMMSSHSHPLPSHSHGVPPHSHAGP